MTYPIPIIDKNNPFYCPTVSPTSYLATLRKSLLKRHVPEDDNALFSFARNLDQDCFDHEDPSIHRYQDHRRVGAARFRTSSSPDELPPYSPPRWERRYLPPYPSQREHHPVALQSTHAIKRKRSSTTTTTFSDLDGSTKRGRSSESIHDSSFDVSGQAERLFVFGYHEVSSPTLLKDADAVLLGLASACGGDNELFARIQALEDELYGPRVGSETPRGLSHLVTSLDQLLPGIGVRNRFRVLQDLTHQEIADVLGNNGHLTAPVLNALRTSELKSLSLSSSINDADGLNLAGRDIFSVFSKPNSFLFLSELVFSGTPIHDFDLTHIHRLPRLARLALDDTNIGNEAILLLVPLKRSLLDLSIASNPLVDDSAICPIILLSRLSYLSIVDTGIGMEGLRRLAYTIHEEDRAVKIEIPTVCEFYVDNMDSKYMIEPKAPLIVDPAACAALSVTALKRNLSEHAIFNPDILVSGTKAELMERLKKILESRKMDLLVRDMMWGD